MSPDRDGTAGREGLDFFGTIAASVTHELNNVLSVIDQAAGLLGDLAAGAGSGRPVDPGRLGTIRERIDRQVRKGVEIVNRLNRFAHSLDEPEAAFETGAQTENLVSLLLRFADLRKARLEYAPFAEELWVVGSAFDFQHGLFLCLQTVIDASEEGDRIEVGVRRDGDDAVTSIASPTCLTKGKDDPLAPRLTRLLGALGGTHRARTGDASGTLLELRLPVARA